MNRQPGPVSVRIAADAAELEAAGRLRRQIFIEEQGLPREAVEDGLDEGAVHAIALDQRQVVGTARLVAGTHGDALLGRVAVIPSHRGGGLAARLVGVLEESARGMAVTHIEIRPHDYLADFYAGLGYRLVPGLEEVVAGHRVLTMEKFL